MPFKVIAFISLFSAYGLFSLYVYTTGTDTLKSPVEATAEVIEGKELFQKKNCIACHQVFGLGGYIGPELTNTISEPGKGKGYAKALLSAGLNKMPNYHFTEQEMNCLISYLEFIDRSSKACK